MTTDHIEDVRGMVDPDEEPRYETCKLCGAKDCECTWADLEPKEVGNATGIEQESSNHAGLVVGPEGVEKHAEMRVMVPVAWCAAYDDPRMGRIHSDPSMCEAEIDALVSKCDGRIVKVALYTHPTDYSGEFKTFILDVRKEIPKNSELFLHPAEPCAKCAEVIKERDEFESCLREIGFLVDFDHNGGLAEKVEKKLAALETENKQQAALTGSTREGESRSPLGFIIYASNQEQ